MTPAKTSRHRHQSGLGSYFSGSRGSRSRLQLLTAPAGVNGSVMSRLFVASMELVIWEAFENTAEGIVKAATDHFRSAHAGPRSRSLMS